jgi:hypothetical protein
MELAEKLDLIRMLLRGQEDAAADRGFCAGERGDMKQYLMMHGYLESYVNGTGGGYRATPDGEQFLARLERRTLGEGKSEKAERQKEVSAVR